MIEAVIEVLDVLADAIIIGDFVRWCRRKWRERRARRTGQLLP